MIAKSMWRLIGGLAGLVVLVGLAMWVGGLASRIDRLEQDVKGLTTRVQQNAGDAKAASPDCEKILTDLADALKRGNSDEANRLDELSIKFKCDVVPVSDGDEQSTTAARS